MRDARRGPTPATVIAIMALLVALAATAFGREGPDAVSNATSNVKVVKTSFTVTNNQVADGIAKCPQGTKVFSGGFASTGQHAKIFAAGPARVGNGYLVYALVPPVNINAGITQETATITVVAYCAPTGAPLRM